MKTKYFQHETNPHVSKKLHDIIELAELRYQLSGNPHHEYYRAESKKHHGLLRRVLNRLAELGNKASEVSDVFYKEFGL